MSGLCKGPEVKCAFIGRHRRLCPICAQCRVLQVSLSGFHQHVVRRSKISSRRHLSDEGLLAHNQRGLCGKSRSLRLAAYLARAAQSRRLPSHLDWAIAIAIALSIFLASVEIMSEGKKPLRSCLVSQAFICVVLLAFGNVITTRLLHCPRQKRARPMPSITFSLRPSWEYSPL
jgi:hypothetical protein